MHQVLKGASFESRACISCGYRAIAAFSPKALIRSGLYVLRNCGAVKVTQVQRAGPAARAACSVMPVTTALAAWAVPAVWVAPAVTEAPVVTVVAGR